MTKIVINNCYGGFGLSPKAQKRYLKLTGKKCYFYNQTKSKYSPGDGGVDEYTIRTDEEAENMYMVYTIIKYLGDKTDKLPNDAFWNEDVYGDSYRSDPVLIQVVEELGEEANGHCAQLEIIEIPDDVKDWYICDYAGIESVHEKHRSWSV
jgi:hypothetical protein